MLEALQSDLGKAGYTLLLGKPDQHTVDQATKMVRNGVECLVLMGEDHPPELFAMLERRKVFHVIVYTSGGVRADQLHRLRQLRPRWPGW